MALQPFRQDSFAAGELAPRLWGATRLAKFFAGLRRCHNFFLAPEGAALNRAGTTHVLEAKDSAAAVDRGARLIPFIFSEDLGQAYVLEFGQGYVRFHVGGATIATPDEPAWDAGSGYAAGARVTFAGHVWVAAEAMGVPSYEPGTTYETYVYLHGISVRVLHLPWSQLGVPFETLEVATPYLAADLPFLKYAQQGDVITLTCKGYDPLELRRLGHASWTLTAESFDVPTANGAVYVSPSSIYEADATHLAKQWDWLITEIWQDDNGLQWETAPLKVNGIAVQDGDLWEATFSYPLDAVVLYGGELWKSTQAANLNHQPEVVMAGEPPAATYPWWTNVGVVLPDPVVLHSIPLPSTVVVYPDKIVTLWVYGNWATTVPGARLVARRVFRGRGTFHGYVGEFSGSTFLDTGDVPDLTLSPPQGRNPFKVFDANDDLVRTEQPAVVTYNAERRVFAGTAQRPSTVFLSRVGDYFNFDRHSPSVADDAFEPELVGRKREEIRWAIGLGALVIGTQSSIWSVRPPQGVALGPGQAEAKIQGEAGASWLDPLVVPPDVLLYVRTKGTGVRDLVYDGGREGFIGSDLSILARHLVTKKGIVAWAYQEDPWSVVWAVRSDGKLLSLTYVRDQEVWAWAWHETQGLVEDVCVIPEGTEDVVYLLVKRQKGDGTWHRYVERMASRVIEVDTDGEPVPGAAAEGIFLDGAVTARGLAYNEGLAGVVVTGLGHLEGLSVVALADATVYREDPAGEPLVVTGGQVVVPDPDGAGYDVVHVGLPYVSDLELLDLALQNANVRNQVKNVGRVAFELEASRGLQVAERFDAPEEDWVEWEQRTVEDGYDPLGLFSGMAEVVQFSTWNKKGRAALRQVDPLPCTVLAVTREADVGGA